MWKGCETDEKLHSVSARIAVRYLDLLNSTTTFNPYFLDHNPRKIL